MLLQLLPERIENAFQYCAIEYKYDLLNSQNELTGEEEAWMSRAWRLIGKYNAEISEYRFDNSLDT